MDVDGDGSSVALIYSGTTAPNELAGDATSGWNREHLWPRSFLGLSSSDSESGPAFVDLHHLRPSGWGVNSARGNKYFGPCLDAAECTVPAHPDAASDTEADAHDFLPPESVRGDIARALFYMDVRYNATNYFVDLVLSDCLGGASGTMGYLSQLLEWHQSDPVDDGEADRNTKVCSWQGNRNPFVDIPNLAEDVYGTDVAERPYDCPPTVAPAGDGSSSPAPSPAPGPSSPAPATAPTTSSGAAPSSPAPAPSSSAPASATCSDALPAGSLAVVGVNSMNPDQVSIVALTDVPAGVTIYMTDNGWDGSALRRNEGVVSYTFPSVLPAGQLLEYERHTDPAPWVAADGGFAFSMYGDSVLLFCAGESTGSDPAPTDDPHFVAGFSWSRNASAWSDAGDATTTSLPAQLEGMAVGLDDNKGKSFVYVGPREGLSGAELLESIVNSTNWNSSATDRYNVTDMAFAIGGVQSTSGGSATWCDSAAGVAFVSFVVSCTLASLVQA
jgi:endonuclease I